MDTQTSLSAPPQAAQETIDLGRLLRLLWSYRRVIAGGTVASLLVYGAYLFSVFMFSPITQTGTLHFKLKFDDDRYPNEARFAPDDILAVPVLEEVYAANQFQRFSDFARFRDALMVTRSSADLDMLATEYRSRLAETRLSAPDRARLEVEFANKRAALLADPNYAITMTWQSRTQLLPAAFLGKVVGDVLATWARQAVERKGVLQSRLSVFSPAELRREVAERTDEPLIAIDALRLGAARLQTSTESLRLIEGAFSARTGSALSLGDLRARLDDAANLRIQPIFARLIEQRVWRSFEDVQAYFVARRAAADLTRRESAARIEATRRSLRTEAAVAPTGDGPGPTAPPAPLDVPTQQAGGASAFFDSVLRMSSRKEDARFRRTYVNLLLEQTEQFARHEAIAEDYTTVALALARSSGTGRPPSPAEAALIAAVIKEVDDLGTDLQSLTNQLLERNLSGAAMLYAITEPFGQSMVSAWANVNPRVTAALIVVGCLILLPLACLAHAVLSRREGSS